MARPRRPKQHKVAYTLIDDRRKTIEEYFTVNGRFTMMLPPYEFTGPDGKDWQYDPETRLESVYVGYGQPGRLTLRERFADAWDAFRGRELPRREAVPPKAIFVEHPNVIVPKEVDHGADVGSQDNT